MLAFRLAIPVKPLHHRAVEFRGHGHGLGPDLRLVGGQPLVHQVDRRLGRIHGGILLRLEHRLFEGCEQAGHGKTSIHLQRNPIGTNAWRSRQALTENRARG